MSSFASFTWVTNYKLLEKADLTFTAIDFETTGLSHYRDRIVEIGAIRFTVNGACREWTTLINPGIPVTPGAQRVHGISPEMLASAPSFDEKAHDFLSFLDGSLLIAHNASFDINFLNAAIERHKIRHPDFQVIDTLDLARKTFPGLPSYSLGKLAAVLKLPPQTEHRALGDARLCYDLFLRILRERNPGGQNFLF